MNESLVFFGSGPVAATSLHSLLGSFEIEAVITKPRPAHHHGSVPVLELAEEKDLRLYTVSNKLELNQLFNRQVFRSLAGVVVDFGILIPQEVINYFPRGIVNSHFSLLPQWRGADPITFALLSGQKQTGVSLMLIEEALDTGKLLAQASYDIDSTETIETLTANLTDLSNQSLKEVLPRYIAGEVQPVDQDPEQKPTYSRKLTKQDGLMDLSKSAAQLEREVRAFLGWPKSRLTIFDKDVIVTKVRVAKNEDDGRLVLKCNPGFLEILQLVGPSGRTMSGADFLRGYKR